MIHDAIRPEDVRSTRAAAVALHDRDAGVFERMYVDMRQDPFSTAFSYGRSKLDALLGEYLRELPAGSRILDAGCGTGEQVRRYREAGFDVVGVEPAPRMREIAQRTNPGVPVVDGSVLEIPCPDASFDMVTAIEVLRYLDRADWERAYREMLRVLRPGGMLFVTLVNRYALDAFLLFDRIRGPLSRIRGRIPTHHEFSTPAEARRQLEAAGAGRVEVHGLMLAPLRLVYKLHPRLGSLVAGRVCRMDDRLSRQRWHTPLAGHLVVVAWRPTG